MEPPNASQTLSNSERHWLNAYQRHQHLTEDQLVTLALRHFAAHARYELRHCANCDLMQQSLCTTRQHVANIVTGPW